MSVSQRLGRMDSEAATLGVLRWSLLALAALALLGMLSAAGCSPLERERVLLDVDHSGRMSAANARAAIGSGTTPRASVLALHNEREWARRLKRDLERLERCE